MELDKQDLGKVCLTMNGEFNPTISYEELCCVYVEDDSALRSFISRKPVPAGTDIYNREYWQPVCYGGGSPTPSQYYTLKIIAIPSDATVLINGVAQKEITAKAGTIVSVEVSRVGYKTYTAYKTLTYNETLRVTLEKEAVETFTLYVDTVTPSNAVVKLNGSIKKQITVTRGTVVKVEANASGYKPYTNNITVTSDRHIDIVLEEIVVVYNTLTINPTPSDSTVIINNVSSIGSVSKNYPKGTTINWSVLKDGYITKSDNLVLDEDRTINVVLEEIVPDEFTYKVNPTPSDATVEINGIKQKQITVAAGTSINVKVSKRGYITQTFVRTITKETIENIQLLVDTYKLIVRANPSDAIIKIDGVVQSSKSFDFLNTSDNTIKGTIEVSKDGYDTVRQEYTITYGGVKETTVEISLGSNYINITPTILIFDSASTTPQNVIVDSSDSWTAK